MSMTGGGAGGVTVEFCPMPGSRPTAAAGSDRDGCQYPGGAGGSTVDSRSRRWCHDHVTLLRVWIGAEVRHRWRAHAVLALLVAVVAAVAFTTAAGARATASAYDRFNDHQAVPDVEMDSLSDEARTLVANRPEVATAGGYSVLFAGPARDGGAPGRDFIIFAANDGSYGRTIDRPILLHGRLADPARADEIVVNEAAAAAFDLPAGS